jgi:hypothetical protein
MRRVVAPLMVLLLAVLHGPTQAQALMSSFFSGYLPAGTNEPAMLVLTGVVLLSLARLGKQPHSS